MKTLVFDTGALVALERDHVRLVALLDTAIKRHMRLRTTAPVLTEFLGAAPRARRESATYASSHLRIGTVDEDLARRAAYLRQRALDRSTGRTRPSAIDALVVADAEAETGVVVFDGDRGDFAALADASGDLEIKELAELTK